jgi:hypothetical protein
MVREQVCLGTIVIRNHCAREQYDNNQARNKWGKSVQETSVEKENVWPGTFVLAIPKAESNQRMI